MSRPSDRALIWDQIRYQNTIFWRTPVAAFFTLAFPLMFLIVFTLIFGNEEIPELGVTTAQFYAPALAVFGAVSATYTNLAIGTAISRDLGILKRVRGTPLPPWMYLAGRIGSAAYLAAISAAIMLGFGIAFFGVRIYPEAVPSLLITFAVGVACWSALGMLAAALSPSGESAPAVTNATLLPLAFISDIFIPPGSNTPGWVTTVGEIFPLKPFATAFQDAFNPQVIAATEGWLGHVHWPELGVMATWGIGAVLLAIRLFRWEPKGGERVGRKTPVAVDET
ncbi:ABC transporter permease [soil metagenome]